MTPQLTKPTVLVLDDEKNIRHAIEIALEQEGFHVLAAHDVAAALRTLDERIVDVMILDIKLGEVDGIALFKRLQAEGRAVPTIFISGHATLTEAAQAIKIGGFDFLEKPFSAEKITVTVRRCLELSSMKERLRLVESSNSSEIVGDSLAIRQVVADALKVAKTDASVLITGESGTGKELVANTIHANSSRHQGPMIKVNCSAIPEQLIENELFGHERGAFTGAVAAKRGFFECAHRGTIFLDEVADLSLSAQAKILRVLQSGELQKVGSEKVIRVDVRLVSGTHKDLRAAVETGAFRGDLFYRLNVVPIKVPSLRDRIDDIPLLVRMLSQRLCAKNNLRERVIDDDVFLELKRHRWAGNVRELQNVLERMLIMSGDRVTTDDLPEELLADEDATASHSSAGSSLKEHRDNAEREFVIGMLKKNNGNVTQAALEMRVRRTYLHRRMSVLSISKRDFLV
ncbi:MAG TPA: sigma-54 dependent transcriptional regulator [Steroidobacteraceae bacterium]|nr:sigma-54 dependent transcriptional regulator [Steroidobacteraceae bacterium]